MGTLLNRRRYMGGVGEEPLPQGAVKVEYLKSAGTQLIDTGISGGTDCEYEVIFKTIPGTGNFRVYFGATQRENALPKVIQYSTTQLQYWDGSSTVTKQVGTYNVKYKVEYKNGDFYVDDVLKYTMGTSGFGSKNFCAFGYLAESGTMSSNMQLYSLKLWKDGTLVRDMIPCRVETTGYMYDKVSGTLFGNAGTGNFTLGPDI
jgi:hypothetical protein